MTRLTYPQYNDVNGWNEMLPRRTPRPALTGRHKVKHAIIGAGYTGLAIARRLLELDPKAEIMVLEASEIGEGSSGRNSGFTGAYALPRGVSMEKAKEAEAMSRYTLEGMDWLKQLIAENNIDCQLTQSGSFRGAATDRGEANLRDALAVVEKFNIKHAFLNRDEMHERTGTAYYRYGLFIEDNYLLQPAALIRGLADSLPAQIGLFENSPVTRINKTDRWHLELEGGQVEADNLFLATNAFIKRFGYLQDRLVTIYTYAAITESIPETDRRYLGSSPAWGIVPSHRLGTTCRRIGEDRLMVRSLYSYEHEMDPEKVRAALRSCFYRRWPQLSHINLQYIWGGTTALTMNGSPYWGKLEDGLYASAGCNGGGINKGTLLGKKLAELALGHGDHTHLRQTYGQANWVAPEPFRTIGFNVISTMEKKKADLEM